MTSIATSAFNFGGLNGVSTKVTCAGSQSTVTFASIPGTFSVMQIDFLMRATGSVGPIKVYIKFNNDGTSGHYNTGQRVFGDPPTTVGTDQNASSSKGAFVTYISGTSSAADPLSAGRIIVPAYAQTVLEKGFICNQMVTYASSNGMDVNQAGGQWFSTAAITQVDLQIDSGSFLDGSMFICTLIG